MILPVEHIIEATMKLYYAPHGQCQHPVSTIAVTVRVRATQENVEFAMPTRALLKGIDQISEVTLLLFIEQVNVERVCLRSLSVISV